MLRFSHMPSYSRARESGNAYAVQFNNAAFDALMRLAFESSSASTPWALLTSGSWCMSTVGSRVAVGDGMTVELSEAKFAGANELEHATTTLTSDDPDAAPGRLAEFVEALVEKRRCRPSEASYVYDMRPSKSDVNVRIHDRLFRDRAHHDPVAEKLQRIVGAPRALTFSRHPFSSTKTFANLAGASVKELRRRIEFFLGNRDWYERKGIPYQLGIMLTGECGTGKSSAIRAIANATGRSIVNVNLSGVATASQLKRLLQQEALSVLESDEQVEPAIVKLPVAQRIFVIDEIDAVGSLVSDRSGEGRHDVVAVPDELTLGEILNVMDGGIEVPGRILVMISNYPERLDRALVRPGRIDIHVTFGLADRDTLADLYKVVFDEELDPESVARLPDRQLSPSHASEIMISEASLPNTDANKVIDRLVEVAKCKIEFKNPSTIIF